MNKTIRVFLISLLVLAGMAVFITVYFLMIIPGKEKELNSRGFRILHSIENDIRKQKENIVHTILLNKGESNFKTIDLDHSEGKKIILWDSSLNPKPNGDAIAKAKGDFSFIFQFPNATYYFKIADFLPDLLSYRNDFFQDYLLVEKEELIYSSNASMVGFHNGIYTKADSNQVFADSQKILVLGGIEYIAFFHGFKLNSQTLHICGLIPSDQYNQDRYFLTNYQLIILSLGILILVSLLPFVKILTMSRFERLVKGDGIALIVALFLMSSFITLVFLVLDNRFQKTKDVHQVRLKTIACEVETNLNNEISNFKNCLALLNTKLTHTPDNKIKDSIRLFIDSSKTKQLIGALLIDSNGSSNDFYFKQSSLDTIKVPDRDYFKKVNNNPSFGAEDYYIQPIYSWINQKNTIVLSQKFRDTSVLALEAILTSVTQPAIPEEFGFCIINAEGQVQFHSDNKRNLRENLFEETANNHHLLAAIHNRSSQHLNVNYYGNECKMYVRYMKDLAYFIVVYENETYAYDNLSEQITFAFTQLLILLGFILILSGISVLLAKHISLLKRQRINLRWLHFTNINTTILLNINVFLILALIVQLIAYHFLKSRGIIQYLMIFLQVLETILGCVFLMYFHSKENIKGIAKLRYLKNSYKNIALLLLVVIVFTNLMMFLLYSEGTNYLGIKAISVQGLLLFFPVIQSTSLRSFLRLCFKKYIKIRHANQYGNVFSLCIVLIISITCIIPVWEFYKTASREESDLNFKRRSLYQAEKIKQRMKFFIDNDLHKNWRNNVSFQNGIYLLHANEFITSARNSSLSLTSISTNEDTLLRFYNRFITSTKFYYNSYEKQKIFLHDNHTDDSSSWNWSKNNADFVLSYYKTHTEGNWFSDLPDHFRIVNNPKPNLYTNWSLVFAGTLFIILLFVLVLFIYKKISLIDYFDKSFPVTNVNLKCSLSVRSSMNVVIITLPGNDRIIYDEIVSSFECLEEKASLLTEADLKESKLHLKTFSILNPDEGPDKLVVLQNFEMRGITTNNFEKKLDQLSDLFLSAKIKVVWIAHEDPFDQIVLLRDHFIKTYHNLPIEEKKDVAEVYLVEQKYEKMLNFLDDFIRLYLPLQHTSRDIKSQKEACSLIQFKEDPGTSVANNTAIAAVRQFIKEECSAHGQYMSQLPAAISVNLNEKSFYAKVLLEERLVLQVEELAKGYYLSIWACLSNEEKYVLYDLALDNLTNYKNFSVLYVLIAKGLVIYNGEISNIKIFNKSFRNFILKVIDPSEALIIEKKIKKMGAWETTRVVLTFALLFGGIFLFFTQQSMFNRLMGLISAVSSGIPAILNLINSSRPGKVSG